MPTIYNTLLFNFLFVFVIGFLLIELGDRAAMLELLASQPHARLHYLCPPQHTDIALYPIVGQIERAALIVFALL
jgi:hypothetical protein